MRKSYLDYLRIISCFSVITLHVSALWSSLPAADPKCMISNLYILFHYYAVPIFVMISGVLFLNPEKEIDLKGLWKDRIFKFAVLYVVWQLFYMITTGSLNIDVLHHPRAILFWIMKPYYALWYLPMQIGLYIVTPFIREITKSKKYTVYWMGIACVTNVLLEFVKAVNGERIISFSDSFMIHMLSGWTFYFVLGYFLDSMKANRTNSIIKYGIYLATTGLLIYAVQIRMANGGAGTALTFSYFYSNNWSIVRVMYSCSLFLLCKDISIKLQKRKTEWGTAAQSRVTKTAGKLSKLTFGVYLLHIFVIEEIRHLLGGHFDGINPVWGIPTISILVLIICMMVTWFVHKIPKLGTYFM